MPRLTIALLCSATLLGAQDDLDKQLRGIIDAYAIAAENAADPVNSEQALYAGAIPAMLRKLDPHSVFFDPEQFEHRNCSQNPTRPCPPGPSPPCCASSIRIRCSSTRSSSSSSSAWKTPPPRDSAVWCRFCPGA